MKRPLLPIAAALCVGCAAGGLLDVGLVWIAAIGMLFCAVMIVMLRFGVRYALLSAALRWVWPLS